ncbi:MAG: hypothetical protein LM558_05125, partial [Thermosphaera sp.]|nr:hypothetical protein [Thermosphaera sp.]
VGREVLVCYREGVDLYGIPSCEGKTYGLRRGEEASFYTIGVKAVAQAGGSQLTGGTYVTVYVRELPGLAFPFSVLGGFISWLMNLLTGGTLDPTRLFYAPVFRLDGPEGEWYRTVLTASIALLPIFILFRIAPGLAYEPGRAVVDGFRDAAFAVIAMILIPHAYNVTAGALNTFTEMLMGPAGAAIVSQMAGTAIAWAIVFMVVSLVSPGVGFLGTLILITVLLIAALSTLRWFLLLAVVSISPFLVLAWLHPYLRGAVDNFKGLVGVMLVTGPVAAMFTLLFSKVMLGDNPLQQFLSSFAMSWLGVFIVGLLPQVVSGLAVTSLGGTIASRLESTVRSGAPQVSRAVLAGSARGLVAGATVAGTAAYARAMRVKPIADRMRAAGVMVGKAREGLSRAVERVRRGVGERVSQAAERARTLAGMVRQSERRQEALGNLRGGVEEVARLSGDAEAKRLRLVEAAGEVNELEARKRELEAIRELRAVSEEYRQKYSEEYLEAEEAKVEQQLQQARQKLAQARAEYEAAEKALNARMEELKRQIQVLEKEGVLTGEESRDLQLQIKIPEVALKTLNKMVEEEEYQRQVMKADRGWAETQHVIYRGLMERIETGLKNLRQLRDRTLSWLGIGGKKEEKEVYAEKEKGEKKSEEVRQWPQWM